MSPAARRRLVTIAVLSLLLDCIRVGLARIPVPYEAVYPALQFMFYPVAGLGQGLTAWAGLALNAACVLVPVALVAAALSPWPVPRALLSQLRRWALALPILYFITSDLSRWVMNGIYAGSRWAPADLTPAIERVEAPLVEAVQALGGPVLTRVLATGYSTVWILALLAAQHGARGLSRGCAVFAAVTAFSIVYMGRHWVTDIVAALPFTVGLVWVARRVDERLAAARLMTLLRE